MLLRRARQLACKASEGSLFGLLRGCRPISSATCSFAPKRGGDGGEDKDGEGDGDGKRTRAKREIISDEEVETTLHCIDSQYLSMGRRISLRELISVSRSSISL